MACSGSRNQSAYSRMRETVNKTLLWGRSVGKCQVSVLQFLKISKLLIPEINNRTLENSVAKPRLLAERHLPRGQADPRGPAHWTLTSVCDISSLPWFRQLKGAAAWSSTDSPLAEGTSEERSEKSSWRLAMLSHHWGDSATFSLSQTWPHIASYSELRLLQLIPIKVRSELAFYILSESGNLSSSGIQKLHVFT